MTYLNKTLLIASASLIIAGSASAFESVQSQASDQAEPIVKISSGAVQDAQNAFDQKVILDASVLDVTPASSPIDGEDLVYTDGFVVNFELTDDAFIGITDINDAHDIHTPKGGFPEGRYIEPIQSVAGGGIKTTF